MDKQAWCIKGPDGRLCTTISTISEQDAWDIFMGGDDSPDRYKADGYRAVLVTVSETDQWESGTSADVAGGQAGKSGDLQTASQCHPDSVATTCSTPTRTVNEQNAAQGMESVSAYQRQNDAEHSPAAAPPCQDAPAAATAKQQYEQFTVDGEDADPIERLRFFCSLAMKEQDWLDVEPFFDALSPPAEARKLADDFNRALNSYGFADMYLARKIVSALRGGRIDALLSGKERP